MPEMEEEKAEMCIVVTTVERRTTGIRPAKLSRAFARVRLSPFDARGAHVYSRHLFIRDSCITFVLREIYHRGKLIATILRKHQAREGARTRENSNCNNYGNYPNCECELYSRLYYLCIARAGVFSDILRVASRGKFVM